MITIQILSPRPLKKLLRNQEFFLFSKKHRSETGFEEAVMNEATVWPQNGADRRAVEALRIQSCHLDQKTAGNLRISGFFLCNLHKCVSLVPFPCNYFATFQNVPKGRKHQYTVDLQFPDTTYCIFPSDLHNSPGKDTAWNSRAPPPSPV